MKTTINTNLFPIIHVGMYDTILSPENMFDDYQEGFIQNCMENMYYSEFINELV